MIRQDGDIDPADASQPVAQTEDPQATGSDLVEGSIPTESIIEAILVATDSPVSAQKIANIIGDTTPASVKACVVDLNVRYEQTGAAFRIEEIAKGYQILTLPEYNVWLRKLLKVRSESKLSSAALETLAVVAYKQPVMRAGIEEIRGVGAGEMLNRLREMNLVKIVGRAEELGRPLLYGTTRRFLEVFGLASLAELPKVEELTPPPKPPAAKSDSQEESSESADQPADPPPADDTEAAFARLAQEANETTDESTEEAPAPN